MEMQEKEEKQKRTRGQEGQENCGEEREEGRIKSIEREDLLVNTLL